MAEIAGPEKGLGFRLAKEALGSCAERIEISIYDLSPERIGQFDVVVCGTLLLHLRDPLRALEAARSVCASRFMSIEEIRPELTARHLRLPVAELNGVDDLCQWWIPNLAGHRRMVQASGFEIERTIPPYATPLGRGHSPLGRSWDARKARALTWLLTRRRGILTSALLARPRTS